MARIPKKEKQLFQFYFVVFFLMCPVLLYFLLDLSPLSSLIVVIGSDPPVSLSTTNAPPVFLVCSFSCSLTDCLPFCHILKLNFFIYIGMQFNSSSLLVSISLFPVPSFGFSFETCHLLCAK